MNNVKVKDLYTEAVERINTRSESHRKTDITKRGEVITIQDAGFFGSNKGRVIEYKVPAPTEELVVPYSDPRAAKFVDAIDQVNIMLTNACNLNCTYCHEQHRKDFGTWDLAKVHSAYHWLNIHSKSKDYKSLQFFGGEPLIHKTFIMDYLETYKEELSANKDNCAISVITNGLLLDEPFIEKFFSYDFTWLTLSLDTFDVENDHREITEKQMARIHEALRLIQLHSPKTEGRKVFTVRCTLSRETAPTFREFVDTLAGYGVKDMIVHPLTMSNYQGYVEWSDEEWNKLLGDLEYAISQHGIEIQFTEGVAQRGSTGNCLVGNQMISVDATGDYSGCYFFTNLKNVAQPFILGNIFDNQAYVDRYEHFQNVYESAFTKHEKCRTCNMQNYCFQCPAGHADVGRGDLITPDSMCQKIVGLYLKLEQFRRRLKFMRRLKIIEDAFAAEPHRVDELILRSVQILEFRKLHGHWPLGEYKVDLSRTLGESLVAFYPKGHEIQGTPDLYDVCLANTPSFHPESSNAFMLAYLHFI